MLRRKYEAAPTPDDDDADDALPRWQTTRKLFALACLFISAGVATLGSALTTMPRPLASITGSPGALPSADLLPPPSPPSLSLSPPHSPPPRSNASWLAVASDSGDAQPQEGSSGHQLLQPVLPPVLPPPPPLPPPYPPPSRFPPSSPSPQPPPVFNPPRPPPAVKHSLPPPPLPLRVLPEADIRNAIAGRLNARFQMGHPSNSLAEAGVLIHLFDGDEERRTPWLSRGDSQWWSSSIINIRAGNLFADHSGLVISPEHTRLHCSYPGE